MSARIPISQLVRDLDHIDGDSSRILLEAYFLRSGKTRTVHTRKLLRLWAMVMPLLRSVFFAVGGQPDNGSQACVSNSCCSNIVPSNVKSGRFIHLI